MKPILPFLFLLLFGIPHQLQAQDYTTGIGLRGGPSSGVTIKHFIDSKRALEGIVNTRWRGFNATVLIEVHDRFFKTNRLNWYYGVGGHVGYWNGDRNPWFNDDDNYTVIGIDGIIGLEYNFAEIPFNISIDWKPAWNVIGHTGFWGDDGGFALRFVF